MKFKNGEYIIEYIKKCFEENSPMNQVTHEKLIELYRKYLCIGGMTEMVEDFISNNMNILEINRNIKRFKPKYAIRISSKNFGFENGIKFVPLYATFLIK